MKRQAALFVCALVATWLVDAVATSFNAAYPALERFSFLAVGLPPLICWLLGFRGRQLGDVLAIAVVGAVGSATYVAATWQVWPEANGGPVKDSAGLFELAALLVVWFLVTTIGAVLGRAMRAAARRAA